MNLVWLVVICRRPRDRRQVINGIRWRIRTGAPWRDVPERYGPWEASYCLSHTWQRDGRTQAEFLSFAARDLLSALREVYGKSDDAVVRAR